MQRIVIHGDERNSPLHLNFTLTKSYMSPALQASLLTSSRSHALPTMDQLGVLTLDPSKPLPDRRLHLPFDGVDLVTGHPPLPVHLRIAQPPSRRGGQPVAGSTVGGWGMVQTSGARHVRLLRGAAGLLACYLELPPVASRRAVDRVGILRLSIGSGQKERRAEAGAPTRGKL
ncbi:hypothetical protein HPP92_000915 [Vanilla planifolia]|uniref:Uncharacterized protein n=1 Tax=Vanilla planifolia TaxID=51239 RepID=A0A835VL30_VANPL|nr:hypothetical protein HPP92_000915 [Vanilla planifolia]